MEKKKKEIPANKPNKREGFYQSLREKLKEHRLLIILLLFYLIPHLINLTKLPIFNDESIYLDWGWFNVKVPEYLFNSLTDAKQPLMIWIFGVFENFLSNPLFAGRLVSVLVGAITMVGVFKVARKIFNKTTAVFASLLYSVVPLFVFYDRLALLEASITCVGIWSFYVLNNLIQRPKVKKGIWLGLIFGTGFFIKSSSLIFIVSASLIIFFLISIKNMKILIKPYLAVVYAIVLTDFIFLLNPIFWETFSSNSRYTLTIKQILSFPASIWLGNIIAYSDIALIFLTPFVLLSAIVGVLLMRKSKNADWKIFLSYFLISLVAEVFVAKGPIKRYIVPFLSFTLVPASYYLSNLWKGGNFKKLTVAVVFSVPLLMSLSLIFKPYFYIEEVAKFTKYSDKIYISGQTSGVGIREAMQYLVLQSPNKQTILVFIANNAGNPENAVSAYAQKLPNIVVLHLDSSFFTDIKNYGCANSDYPTFFVARGVQLSGMDKFFTLAKSFPTYESSYSVNVYKLKTDCAGKSLPLSQLYRKLIDYEIALKTR